MGIYIPGMMMPKDGYIDVRLFADGWAHIPTDEPPYNRAFKAIELPPHGRLGDLDALCEGRVSNDPVVIHAKTADTIIPADPEKEDT